ncbi:MAG: DUF222 domain-containing protein [Gordonia amarae]
MDLGRTAADLAELDFGDEVDGRVAFEVLRQLLALLNVAHHHAAMLVGVLDRLGVATKWGGSVRQLLIDMGCAPSVASRLVRVGASLPGLAYTGRHTRDGDISLEHADAVVTGLVHIERRAGTGFDSDERAGFENALVAQVFSGASPAEVAATARGIGNDLAGESDSGIPAAENRSIDEFTVTVDADGRTQVRGDLDAIIGEKLATLVDAFSEVRPEPDGSPDVRSAGRRRADAVERILDAAMSAHDLGMLTGAPKTSVLLSVPSDTPDLAKLPWVGPVSRVTTEQLTCDASITTVVIDGETVPLQMGRDRRLFPAHLRKAIIVRDGGACIKCGAPASWTQVHHIEHWSRGGETNLDNGCLVCTSCHDDIHNRGWDVTIGYDRHPWLVPPATVDPRRRPLPAYNRRTMRLDNAA